MIRSAGAIFVLCGLAVFGPVCRCSAGGIIEYPIPTGGCNPEAITLGPDGAFWFVEFQVGRMGRITTGGVVTEYVIPTGNAHVTTIVAGPDTNLWFAVFQANEIGRITTNGAISEYPMPPGTIPYGLTFGPDGRLWVVDFGAQTYVPGTPTNGGIFAFTMGTNGPTATNYYNTGMTVNSRPAQITTGPDGNLWFTEQAVGRIGRITTNGVITEFPLTGTNCAPYDIITGPDGAIWFTESYSNKLGRLDTVGNLTEYPLPTSSFSFNQPYGLVLGADGNIWFSDAASGEIGQVVLSGTNITVTKFATPTANSRPRRLAAHPDGSIWFGEFPQFLFQNFIGRFLLPSLNFSRLTNSEVVITWPTNFPANFVLQTNGDLNTTNWGTVTNVPEITNGQFTVTNNATNSQLFYRLFQ